MRSEEILNGCTVGRVCCASGNPIRSVYEPRVMSDGSVELVETGTENTDELIQAELVGTELKYLLAKYLNGDPEALKGKPSFYADVTGAPKTYAEAMDVVLRAQLAFEQLPIDVKKEFGSDWRRWLASFDKPVEKVVDVDKAKVIPEDKENDEK